MAKPERMTPGRSQSPRRSNGAGKRQVDPRHVGLLFVLLASAIANLFAPT